MNRPLYKCLLLLTLACSTATLVLGQGLEASIDLPPPHPNNFNYYRDLADNGDLFITLTNPGGSAREIYLLATIRRGGRVFAAMDPSFRPSAPINLPANETRDFDGGTLRELNLRFSRADVTGVTPSELDAMLRYDMMPPATYSLCIKAFDFNTRAPITLNGEEEICTIFEIADPGYAELITPENGELLDALDEPEVFISWAYNGFAGSYDIRYRLKLIDLTESGLDPTLATSHMLDEGVPVFYETDPFGLDDFTYVYGVDPTDPRLTRGHQYAVRVTAFESEDLLVFPQGGHSNVHVFTYGAATSTGDCLRPSYALTARYPLSGDTLPFNFVPCVAQVEPLCDEYRRLDFDFTLSQNPGSTYSRSDRNVWDRRGPHGYLQDLLGGTVSRERASHFVFNLEAEQRAAIGPLESGANYSWRVESTMQTSSGTNYPGSSALQSFVHGMPAPRLSSPAHQDTIAPGSLTLSWLTGQAPDQLLPEYLNLIRAERSEVIGYESVGQVFEACVLQVARSRDFTERQMVAGQKTDLRLSDLNQSSAAIAAALYREMSFGLSLTDTGTYFWRVVWLKDITYPVASNGYLAAGRSYHPSAVRSFYIGGGGRRAVTPESPTAGSPDDGDCESTCLIALPSSTSPRSILLVGDSVRLGRFTLVPTEVSGTGAGFSGSGTIAMPFLNDLRVMVNFTGIRINGAGEAFTGSAKAIVDPMPFDIIAGTGLGSSTPVPSVSPEQLGLLNAAISGTERLVSALTDRRAIGLPLGFDRELGGYQAILGIVAMDFTTTAADLDIVCSLELPEFGGYIGLGIGDWCFKPSGLGSDGRLYVPQDIPLNPGEDIVFKISGGAASDSTNITYAEFDCSGLTCLQLRGELEFDRSILLPDTTRITDPDAKVTASLRAKVCLQDGFDLLVEGRLESFIAPGLDNFTWAESQLWVDLSDRENPTGLDVPSGYRWPAAGRARNTWKGIYIPRVMLQIPDQLEGAGPATTVGVDHFIVDFRPAAISFRVAAYNVVRSGQANINGWGISIDTLYAAIIQTRDLELGLSGKLEMPITETGQHLLYRAALNTRGLDLGVSVDPAAPFGVPIMAAQLTLKPNTFLNVHLGFTDTTYIEARLNGVVSISGEQAQRQASSGDSPGMSMPGIEFEDVYFHTGRSISRPGVWSPASPEKTAAGFPLQIEDMGLDFSDWEHPGFFIRPRLVIMSGSPGIAGEAELHFYGTINREASGIEKISLDRVELTEIAIEANISKVKLAGYIRWRKTGTIDEIAGGLDVTIPMGIRGKMDCTFGSYKANSTADFNTAQYYSYWQVNGLLQFNPGLQIFSGFALYGLGGGVSYHMDRTTAVAFDEIRRSPKTEGGDTSAVVNNIPNPSSATYSPNFNRGLGLELTVMLGTYPQADAFNMDVSLRAMFLPAGGLARFEIEGDGYVMTGIDERESAEKMVWASVDVVYDATQNMVDGRFKVFLDVKGVLVGQHPDKSVIDAHFFSDPTKWFLKVGTYASPGGIKFKIGDTELANLTEYLMIGHEVPAELPPISDPALYALLYGGTAQNRGEGGSVESDEAGAAALRDAGRSGLQGDLAEGVGFAFGTSLSINASLNPIPFYMTLRLALGMDVFVTRLDNTYICASTGESPGVNGWRGGGQVYAGMWGEFGIGVTFIRELKIPIVELAAGFILQAEVPNPNYFAGRAAVEYSILNGLKEGRKTISFEFGEKCDPTNVDPLAKITLLEDLQPSGNQNVYARAAATFSLPIHQMLEIPRTIPTDGTPPTFYRFWPFIDSWTIKPARGAAISCERPQIRENGYVAYLEPIALLPPNTSMTTEIVLKYRDYSNGATGQIYRRPGDRRDFQEDSVQHFRTGNLPDKIDPSQVKYTYPLDGQRYYLPDVTAGKGTILLTRDHSAMMYTERDGRNFAYVLRYIPLSGSGSRVDIPMSTVVGRQLRIAVPPSLEPSTIYAVQLVRIKRQTAEEERAEMLSSAGASSGLGSRLTPAQLNGQSFARVRVELGGGDYTNDRQTRHIQHSEVARPSWEFKLYQWYFRTSAHQSLGEKLAALSLVGETPHNGLGNRGAKVRGQLTEHFDELEVYGIWFGSEQVVRPLIQFQAHLDDDYFTYHNRYFYNAATRLARLRNLDLAVNAVGLTLSARVRLPGQFPQFDALNTFVQQWTNSYYLDESMSWVLNRLSTGEISSSATVPLAPSSSSAGSSGSGTPTIGGHLSGASAGRSYGSSGGFGGSFNNFGNAGAAATSTASSGPSYNFGLVFQAPNRVFQDRLALSNHINQLFASDVYYLIRDRRIETGTVARGQTIPASAHRISLRNAFANNDRASYTDMLQLQFMRPNDYQPFTNLTPRLPEGSEFSTAVDNHYHLNLRYVAPANLGRESVERDYHLNHVPPTSTGVGPF